MVPVVCSAEGKDMPLQVTAGRLSTASSSCSLPRGLLSSLVCARPVADLALLGLSVLISGTATDSCRNDESWFFSFFLWAT
jgi:hypothetical protein